MSYSTQIYKEKIPIVNAQERRRRLRTNTKIILKLI